MGTILVLNTIISDSLSQYIWIVISPEASEGALGSLELSFDWTAGRGWASKVYFGLLIHIQLP